MTTKTEWQQSLNAQLDRSDDLAGLIASAASRARTEIAAESYDSIADIQMANQRLSWALDHFNDAMDPVFPQMLNRPTEQEDPPLTPEAWGKKIEEARAPKRGNR